MSRQQGNHETTTLTYAQLKARGTSNSLDDAKPKQMQHLQVWYLDLFAKFERKTKVNATPPHLGLVPELLDPSWTHPVTSLGPLLDNPSCSRTSPSLVASHSQVVAFPARRSGECLRASPGEAPWIPSCGFFGNRKRKRLGLLWVSVGVFLISFGFPWFLFLVSLGVLGVSLGSLGFFWFPLFLKQCMYLFVSSDPVTFADWFKRKAFYFGVHFDTYLWPNLNSKQLVTIMFVCFICFWPGTVYPCRLPPKKRPGKHAGTRVPSNGCFGMLKQVVGEHIVSAVFALFQLWSVCSHGLTKGLLQCEGA